MTDTQTRAREAKAALEQLGKIYTPDAKDSDIVLWVGENIGPISDALEFTAMAAEPTRRVILTKDLTDEQVQAILDAQVPDDLGQFDHEAVERSAERITRSRIERALEEIEDPDTTVSMWTTRYMPVVVTAMKAYLAAEPVDLHWGPHFFAQIRDGVLVASYNAESHSITRKE